MTSAQTLLVPDLISSRNGIWVIISVSSATTIILTRRTKAKIPNLVFNIIPEGTSRTIALKSGDVDFVWDVNTADVASLQNNDAITVAEVPSVDAVILFFNNDRAPFDDANLRNAIAAAINREDIIAAALNGYGSVNYSCIASGFSESTDTNAIPYNLDTAKKYLAAWGGRSFHR